MDKIRLATIGYESADIADFIATLKTASVERIIDIRELPISRRKGFAKKALSEALADAGIEYIHLRGLGDPKAGREAARAGDYKKFKDIFNEHMKSVAAQRDLSLAVQHVEKGGACLLCYERSHSECHRSIVAEAISDKITVPIFHLGVRHGLSRQVRNVHSTWISEKRA
ncbi:hypothetical protein CHU95_19050 [Niveispirillum lacus]|uniref:DUF488 domain-containing protein n=2 Tax=Niveispirillum lacus TaxID=1981099 RepID=A0A255YUW7_9PROT|nr:hypothetical protein CHU95_19050 [Niveispirillum lacus]